MEHVPKLACRLVVLDAEEPLGAEEADALQAVEECAHREELIVGEHREDTADFINREHPI